MSIEVVDMMTGEWEFICNPDDEENIGLHLIT